jgi:YD repeat-containing protein
MESRKVLRMKLKTLVVIGAIAPVLLAIQPAAAADGNHRVILAQLQPAAGKDADKASDAKNQKKKAGEAKNKNKNKDKKAGKPNDKAQKAGKPNNKAQKAGKASGKKKQARSAKDKKTKSRHDAQQVQKPSPKSQPRLGGNKDKDKDNGKNGRKSTQQQPAKTTSPAVNNNDDFKRGHRRNAKDKDEKKNSTADRKQDRGKYGGGHAPPASTQANDKRDDHRNDNRNDKRDDHRKEATKYRRLDELRRQRKETHEGNRTVIREQNRTIIRENGHAFIRHDDSDRFRHGARSVHEEHRDGHRVTVIVRPDGTRITTEWTGDGRILRRTRRGRGGREFVLYQNRDRGPRRDLDFIVRLGPLALHIPRDRYIVDAGRADRGLLYDTLIAGPLEPIAHPYTLDEVRYSYDLRERMRRIDLDSINFETGSWDVGPGQARQLEPIAEAMRRAIARNPDEIFLIEGHTDAVGSWEDNLSLADRRAEAVAEILTADFGIPPENLVTQGYGEQHLKVPTQGPERLNRRVTIRRITPLLHS